MPDDAETLRLIRRSLAPGHQIDEHSPEVESTLPDGSRLTAVIPPETEQVTLTIRRYVVRHHRLADLGTLPSEAVELVEAYARSRASMLIAGHGRSGKTTLLRCIVGAGDPSGRFARSRMCASWRCTSIMPAAIPLSTPRAKIEGAGARTHRQLTAHSPEAPTGCPGRRRVRGPKHSIFFWRRQRATSASATIHSTRLAGRFASSATFRSAARPRVSSATPSREMIAEHFDLVIVCGSGPTVRGASRNFEVTGLGKDGVIDGSDLMGTRPRDGPPGPDWCAPPPAGAAAGAWKPQWAAGRLLGFGAALLLAGGTLFLSGVHL